MIRELLSVFCASYLMSVVFLLPAYLFYFFIDSRQVYAHHLHKCLLSLMLCIPILLAIAAYSPEPVRRPQTKQVLEVQALVGAPSDLYGAADEGASAREPSYLDTIQGYHQITWSGFTYLADIVALFILSGTIVFLVRVTTQRRFMNRLERSTQPGRSFRGYQLHVSDSITLPFSTGIVRPKIFLPSGLDSQDAKIILEHEVSHISKKHHYWSLMEAVLQHLFWFNPISHLMHQKGTLLREIECDMAMIQSVDRYTYSRTLLNTAKSSLPSGGPGFMAQRWFRQKTLKKRVENILDQEHGRGRLVSYGFLLALTVAVGAFVLVGFLDDGAWEENLVETVEARYETIQKERDTIRLGEVPNHLTRALILNEDSRFYSHGGVDIRATLRALANNLTSDTLQGASTLSQQLSKALYIDDWTKSLPKKLEMVRAARVIEKHFGKEQILEMYLNSVYFGKGSWGVEQASQAFFDHPARELTVAESAMLIQSLSRPSNRNCLADPEGALARTQRLLERMVAEDGAGVEEVETSLSKLARRFGEDRGLDGGSV